MATVQRTPNNAFMKNPKHQEEQDDLLTIASGFPAGGFRRDRESRLEKWHRLADAHPQKELPVRVCSGRDEWEIINARREKDELSIVSWNILSDTWYEKERESSYPNTPRECGMWEGRFPILLRWIHTLRPDLLALQEVDFDRFETHLLPQLQLLGYKGITQNRRKQREGQPCGVATFWNSEKLELLEYRSGSRSMATQFSFRQKEVCLINVHLECSQTVDGATKRAHQLNSALEWAARVAPGSPLVVCGDFNTGIRSSLLHVVRTREWHSQRLSSVYEHPATAGTLPANGATFVIPGHHYVIDHILYSYDTITLRAALNAFTTLEIEEELGEGSEKSFPNASCPSDHIPIGTIFRVRNTKAPNRIMATKTKPKLVCPYTKEELTTALSEALKGMEPAESFFEKNELEDRIRFLTEELAARLGSKPSDTQGTETDCISKFVKKHVGKEYGKWKSQQK